MGFVPLGIPLVVGPPVLTSIIVTRIPYGYIPTITSPGGKSCHRMDCVSEV